MQERRAVATLNPSDGSARPTAPSPRRRYELVGATSALVVIADQLTKRWAHRALAHRTIHVIWTLRLALATNRGGAFSIGSGVIPFFALAVTATVVVIVTVGRSVRSPAMAMTLGLVLGGALGNLVDRIVRPPGVFRGAVIDFIDVRWWPVFNVADAAITCGCVLLVVLSSRRGLDRPSK